MNNNKFGHRLVVLVFFISGAVAFAALAAAYKLPVWIGVPAGVMVGFIARWLYDSLMNLIDEL